MARWLSFCIVLLSAAPACHAHWTEHPELPAWAQRGRLYWCLHYARADRKLVDLFLDGGQTFVHGGYFDSKETAEYAAQRGLRYMPYVCSRTVTTAEIAQHPQLKEAVVLRQDGSEFLAYNNPVRRYGSLYVPAWPEYVRERTRRVMDGPDVAAIFFDNAMWPGDDHRPETVQAWQRWATQHGLPPGSDVPSLSDGELAAASRAFACDSLTAYHAGLRRFCHEQTPPLLNCPNAGNAYGLAGAEAGAIDLFFYETMSHPPFADNTFLYKAGLAATHGKPTAMLAYLPETIASQRGERTWNEGMHYHFYPSSPLAEEFALAAAEAAACGGVYVVNYSLFPSLPVTDTTDPFCRRIHRAIKQSYSFLHANEDLYARAQPGSDVAVLYSTATDLQDRHLQETSLLGPALTSAGIPYEVVVPADLTGEGMAGIRTLLIPGVAFMDEPTAQGVLRFAEAGGRVAVTGEYATRDTIGRPAQFEAARALLKPLRLVSRPIREWRLEGFEPEGTSQVRVIERVGKASLDFSGPAGKHVADLCLTDENDGTSPFSLAVGDRTVYEGLLDAEDNQQHWYTTPAFDLTPGTTLTLTVNADGGERGRVQSVVLVAADAGTGASLGRGEVLYSPVGLQDLTPERRLALLQPAVRLPQPGKVSINTMTVPEGDVRTVHLVNRDFRYEVTQKGLYASDDGSGEARTFFGRPGVVVRKRLRIAKPEEVAQPVLQVHGFATPDCAANLVIAINGRPAATIPAQNAGSSGWLEAPFGRQLLGTDNLIEVKAEGEVDGQQRWIQIDIDADTNEGNSSFSTDDGRTFSADDLSPDLKAQTGEYMIRIVDRAPEGPEQDPDNAVRDPGFERVRVPHGETKLTVVPAKGVTVQLPGKPAACLAISPDHAPEWLTGRAEGKSAVYTVPQIEVYTVLVLGPSRQPLEPIYQAQMAAAPWSVPPVTDPLRAVVTAWDAYGDGFALDTDSPHSGARCIRCENAGDGDIRGAQQQFDLTGDQPQVITLTAWSRCEGVSGQKDAHYSLYVDATCADGTVFNGHHTPFEVGSHDWQQAALELRPPAPIRTLTLYLLFRKHSGRAWFDDVTMTIR